MCFCCRARVCGVKNIPYVCILTFRQRECLCRKSGRRSSGKRRRRETGQAVSKGWTYSRWFGVRPFVRAQIRNLEPRSRVRFVKNFQNEFKSSPPALDCIVLVPIQRPLVETDTVGNEQVNIVERLAAREPDIPLRRWWRPKKEIKEEWVLDFRLETV